MGVRGVEGLEAVRRTRWKEEVSVQVRQGRVRRKSRSTSTSDLPSETSATRPPRPLLRPRRRPRRRPRPLPRPLPPSLRPPLPPPSPCSGPGEERRRGSVARHRSPRRARDPIPSIPAWTHIHTHHTHIHIHIHIHLCLSPVINPSPLLLLRSPPQRQYWPPWQHLHSPPQWQSSPQYSKTRTHPPHHRRRHRQARRSRRDSRARCAWSGTTTHGRRVTWWGRIAAAPPAA